MKEPTMRLVGGPAKRLGFDRYKIIKAEASNTRLMGVVGLHIHWVLSEPEKAKEELARDFTQPVEDIHQVWCFELEDGRADRVYELCGEDSVKLGEMKNNVFGGLGGKMVGISDREALGLIARCSGKDFAKRRDVPAGARSIYAIACKEAVLNEEEWLDLSRSLCVPVKTDYGLINYFIMRSVCFDTEGAALVLALDAPKELSSVLRIRKKASLMRNVSGLTRKEGGSSVYFCESLIDDSERSWVMISEVSVAISGVSGAVLKSVFPISEWENNSKLNRYEYVDFFSISGDADEFADRFCDFVPKASRKIYDSGILFMDYRSDNKHAENRVFSIADDLKASYFITAAGQLVIASFSAEGAASAEAYLRISPLMGSLLPEGRYCFTSPVLGPFVESGFEDFKEFLNRIL